MQSLFPQSGIPKLQKATANISATPEMVQNAIVGALENSESEINSCSLT